MVRIVVSLTTLPSRIGLIEPTLLSLLEQTRLPDAIYLGLPQKKLDGQPMEYRIPSFIQKLGVIIVPLEKDWGPVCKLFGGWIAETDPSTVIITVDDDVVYHHDLILRLLEGRNKYPDTALSFSGSSFYQFFPFYWGMGLPFPNYGESDTIMGYSGVLYERRFFPEIETLQKWAEKPNLFPIDDITLSAYLSLRGVKRRILYNPFNFIHRIRGVEALSSRKGYSHYLHVAGFDYMHKEYGAFPEKGRLGILNSWIIHIIFAIFILLLFSAMVYSLMIGRIKPM